MDLGKVRSANVWTPFSGDFDGSLSFPTSSILVDSLLVLQFLLFSFLVFHETTDFPSYLLPSRNGAGDRKLSLWMTITTCYDHSPCTSNISTLRPLSLTNLLDSISTWRFLAFVRFI